MLHIPRCPFSLATFVLLSAAGCPGHHGRPTLPPPEYEEPGSENDPPDSQRTLSTEACVDGGAQPRREASPLSRGTVARWARLALAPILMGVFSGLLAAKLRN